MLYNIPKVYRETRARVLNVTIIIIDFPFFLLHTVRVQVPQGERQRAEAAAGDCGVWCGLLCARIEEARRLQ